MQTTQFLGETFQCLKKQQQQTEVGCIQPGNCCLFGTSAREWTTLKDRWQWRLNTPTPSPVCWDNWETHCVLHWLSVFSSRLKSQFDRFVKDILLATFLSCPTLPFCCPVSWDHSPAACTCILVIGLLPGEPKLKEFSWAPVIWGNWIFQTI